MMIDRATSRFAHGSLLSDKQGIQWLISESTMELYAAKLMVMHAAYLIENGMPFKHEVAMAKYHVANTLWKVVDRAIQVHGALGVSADTPLEGMYRAARVLRIADGPDEVHRILIAKNVLERYRAGESWDFGN
jgi:acyl-CoA dehydrogenase